VGRGRSPLSMGNPRPSRGRRRGGLGGSGRCGFRVLGHPCFGRLGSVAGAVELEDHAVVDDPVDGRRRGHGVLEYPVPLGEHQVRGDHHALSLVSLGQEGEQHLCLVPVLLDVPDIVDGQDVCTAPGCLDQRLASGHPSGEPVLAGLDGGTPTKLLQPPAMVV